MMALFIPAPPPVPGVRMVGRTVWLPKTPREEKPASLPSFVAAPAVMTHGQGVQRFCVFGAGPSLPLAKTTTMLLSCSAFEATLTGCSGSYSAAELPQELLTTRML